MEETSLNFFLKKIKSGKHFYLDSKIENNYFHLIVNYINESIKEDENILLPRVIILFDKKERYDEFCKFLEFNPFNKKLISCSIYEKKDKIKLRNELYNGIDIIYGTLNSILELYLQNGFSLSVLKWAYFELESKKEFASFVRLTESMNKGQLLIKCNSNLQESISDLESISKKIYNIDE